MTLPPDSRQPAHRARRNRPSCHLESNSAVLRARSMFCRGRTSNRSRRWRRPPLESWPPPFAATALALEGGGRLFYLGAGTSGRLGVLDAGGMSATFCPPLEAGSRAMLAVELRPAAQLRRPWKDRFRGRSNDLSARGFAPRRCSRRYFAAGGTNPLVLGGLRHCGSTERGDRDELCAAGPGRPHALRPSNSLLTGPELLDWLDR